MTEAGLGSGPRLASTSASVSAISQAMEAIVDNRVSELSNWLALMPLDKISRERIDQLLAMFLTQAWEYGKSDAIGPIFTAWERVYPREERIPFYVILFTIELLSPEILRFVVVESMSGITWLMINNWLLSFHYQEVALACERAWLTFGTQSLTVLETVRAAAAEEQNAPISNFLDSKIALVAEYAPIPVWVRDFREDPQGFPVTEETEVARLPSYDETLYIPPEAQVVLASDRDIIALKRQALQDAGYSQEDLAEM